MHFPDDYGQEETTSVVESINGRRTADLVLMLARLGNALLTFMFAYNYLPGLFDVFGLMGSNNGDSELIIRVIAGFFATIFFDAAYYAWGQVKSREGNSNKQMATADTAKKAALFGSLAASAGQFVLSQLAVELDETIVFGVSLGAMIAVGAIALLHMYWYDKYKGEGFDAMARSKAATDTAQRLADKNKRERDLENLEKKQEVHLHQTRLLQLEAEFELERERLEAQAALNRQLVMQEITHERAVAKQTAELLEKKVNESARQIAEKKAQQARDNFLVGQGMDPNSFRNGS